MSSDRLVKLRCILLRGKDIQRLSVFLQTVALLNAKEADEEGFCPIHEAAYNGAVNVIHSLTKDPSVLYLKNKDDKTPLELAQDMGHHDLRASLQQVESKEDTTCTVRCIIC
eukprot:gb/GECG01009446.1/.p1 GENE.gb/GECG01009446.1/~~gb/GECG01009446.1/.p1  ORF type:complete len:112 (+),score=11.51 gb/GECG01009446.1/:1-336(+)